MGRLRRGNDAFGAGELGCRLEDRELVVGASFDHLVEDELRDIEAAGCGQGRKARRADRLGNDAAGNGIGLDAGKSDP